MSSKKNYSKVKFVKVKVIEQDLRSEQEIEMKKERIAIASCTTRQWPCWKGCSFMLA